MIIILGCTIYVIGALINIYLFTDHFGDEFFDTTETFEQFWILLKIGLLWPIFACAWLYGCFNGYYDEKRRK